MADLIIRGVEMPNSCEKCPFNDHEEGFCFAAWKFNKSGWPEFSLNVGRQETRHHWCPIGQLPERHGRLIDADAILEKLMKTSRYFDLKFDIDAAPTIIPAEGRDE
jgi:hypothetical protein